MITALILAAAITSVAARETPQAIAPGVVWLRGDVPEARGPDGNTVIFTMPQGLVVFDTGRHAWLSDAIFGYAMEQHRSIVAIVNSHWHLDHSSGNRRIKAAFPQAPLYTTTAIDRALTSFLATNLANARARLASGGLTGVQLEEAQGFVDTMAAADSLRPDVPISHSGPLNLGGRTVDVHVTDHAVTDADVWIYDPKNRIVVLGDLVTLPAPFFDTACSERWREALDEVWAIPFRIAVPGHGEPMTRAAFNRYRRAFVAFVGCVHGTTDTAVCAAEWQGAAGRLMPEQRWRKAAREYAVDYATMLREHGGNSAECQKP